MSEALDFAEVRFVKDFCTTANRVSQVIVFDEDATAQLGLLCVSCVDLAYS